MSKRPKLDPLPFDRQSFNVGDSEQDMMSGLLALGDSAIVDNIDSLPATSNQKRPAGNLPASSSAVIQSRKKKIDYEDEDVMELMTMSLQELDEIWKDEGAENKKLAEMERWTTKKLEDLRRRQEIEAHQEKAGDRIKRLNLEHCALQGEEAATIERHNRTMGMLRRDVKRETEAINRQTASVQKNLIDADRNLARLAHAEVQVKENKQELEEAIKGEEVWDEE